MTRPSNVPVRAGRALVAALDACVREAASPEAAAEACLHEIRWEFQASAAVLFLSHGSGVASPWRGVDERGSTPAAGLEELSRTVVRNAVRRAEIVTWDVSEGGDGSALDLGLTAALAVPIGTPPRGALYLDYRSMRGLDGALRHDDLRLVATFLAAHLFAAPKPSSLPPAEPALAPVALDALLSLPGLRALRDDVLNAASSYAPMLITGETGTGKTLIAESIAEHLGLRPVVRAMLGASDDLNTLVSELYGHERGSFSGAASKRIGLVEQAHGGVLVLDEVLNLPMAAQQVLLDFVQFGTYRPLGWESPRPKQARVRLVAVTNGDLREAVRNGRFRQDLFHRLAAMPLHLPPLRERRGDLVGLAEMLLPRIAPDRAWRLSLAARRALVADHLPWEGNVRELEGVLRRAVERARRADDTSDALTPDHLDPALRPAPTKPVPSTRPPVDTRSLAARWQGLQQERAALDQREEALLDEALAKHDQVLAHAAAELGLARTTLASRLAARERARRG